MTIRNGVALITGASSGIGAEFARQLAALGNDLIVVARRQYRLEALKVEIEAKYAIAVQVWAADLAQDEGIAAVVSHIEALPALDYLVNNAGFGSQGVIGETDPERQEAMIRLHVMATMRLSQAVIPLMRRQNRGYIINVSSIAAFITGSGAANYCATKAYINSFSESLQLELRGTGVRVQALCPGYTYSEFHDTVAMDGFERSSTPQFLWLSTAVVVADSLANLNGRKVIVIPGFLYKLMVAGFKNRLLRIPLSLYQRYLER